MHNITEVVGKLRMHICQAGTCGTRLYYGSYINLLPTPAVCVSDVHVLLVLPK